MSESIGRARFVGGGVVYLCHASERTHTHTYTFICMHIQLMIETNVSFFSALALPSDLINSLFSYPQAAYSLFEIG